MIIQPKPDPNRLMEAADACLKAASACAAMSGVKWPVAVVAGAPAQPECLAGFTRCEIEEACQFLVRLGLLERPRAKRVG
jgi:hypothetical protein